MRSTVIRKYFPKRHLQCRTVLEIVLFLKILLTLMDWGSGDRAGLSKIDNFLENRSTVGYSLSEMVQQLPILWANSRNLKSLACQDYDKVLSQNPRE